ncbi:methylmalonyl-CoA epimerase, mitochondrial isoform X5 [Marmota marmota marmota]|uniref:methylmalonyl-CoA epimerase, mitochondrial isoform X5 n=1 Tax=Marmota marmota marmota TaxID=9994 RepID=UPI002093615D|nr:methylmalonyl-CoA epimerase, mitochondrial isoform X5 [Marmota marmota marmota]
MQGNRNALSPEGRVSSIFPRNPNTLATPPGRLSPPLRSLASHLTTWPRPSPSFLAGSAASRDLAGCFSKFLNPVPAVRSFSASQSLHQVADPVWNLGQLNHVAIAVPDLKKSTAFYQNILGAQVDNINAVMMDLKKKKIRILSEEVKIGAHGKPVIFLHPKDCGGVLIELEQA